MTTDRLGAAFIQRVTAEALNSSAIHHPYLTAMRNGDFPDVEFALRDFAHQYGVYSRKFIPYISAVVENLQAPEHQQILLANLAEEQGEMHDIDLPAEVLDSIRGQPHAALFRRFQTALGIDDHYLATADADAAGARWSQQFLQLCRSNECVGVGAIGIGTEVIVSSIYRQILEGLRRCSRLSATERVFFDLHSQCDDEHGAQLLNIAQELATDPRACEQIEYGAHQAIAIRVQFWDAMLERALSRPATQAAQTEVMPVGY